MDQRARFLDIVQRNPVDAAILDRGPALGVAEWPRLVVDPWPGSLR